MSYYGDDFFGGSSGSSSTKGKGIVGYIFSPVTIFLLSAGALALYGLAIRKNVIDTTNERQLEKEVAGLFITGSILLIVASLFTGNTTGFAGQVSIKTKFILSIFLIHLVTLVYPIVNFVWPEWSNIHKQSLQNIVKTFVLVIFVFFLVGCPENMGERGIKLNYVFLVILFEALFTGASIWFGSSLIVVPEVSNTHEFSYVNSASTFSGDLAPF